MFNISYLSLIFYKNNEQGHDIKRVHKKYKVLK